jgi:hypothetical protein
VIISGGVRIAANINIKTMACFLLSDKNLGVIIPIFVRKRLTNGIWKTIPKARVKVDINEIYLLIVIIGVIKSVENLRRKFIPIGTITKYPKIEPKIKKIRDKGTNINVYFFSFFFNPTEINFHA